MHRELPLDEVSGLTLDVGTMRMEGADILVLSPTPTHPPDQGNRKRIFAVCKELQARGARVHFVYYPQEWWFDFLPHDLVREMTAAWDSFHVVPTSRHTYNPPTGQDYTIDEWWDESIATTLKWLFKRQHFDAFIVNYAFMSKALELAPPNVLRILDTHDLFTGRRQLLEQHGLKPEFFYTTREQESIAVQRAQLVWAIKEEEAVIYRSMANVPCITMPHAEPTAQVARIRRCDDEGVLVIGMLGSGNVINVQNARAFVEAALPIFEARAAKVLIRYVGSMCARLGDLAEVEGVELAGPVATVEAFYRDVDLVVIPLAFSTGLKIKAVEAFAAGVPIVAMGHALEGIPVAHAWHQCHTMEEVAEVCCEIAQQPELLTALTAATHATHARIQHQVQAALDATIARIHRRPTVVVTVDHVFFDPESAYREQIYQTINLLMQQAQVVLYVDQLLPSHQTTLFEAFNGLAVDCKLAVAPHVSPPPGRSLGLNHMVVSLPELLARSARPILWIMRFCPELANFQSEALRTPLFVRMDVLRQLGSPPSDQAIKALTDKCQETTWIESHPDAPVPVALGGHVRHMLVPSWRWKPNRLHMGTEAPLVHFLARDDQYALAQELLGRLALLQDLLKPGHVITPKPQATRREDEAKHISLGALMGRFSAFRPMPACVIDLTGNAYEFETLRECYLRCQIPVVNIDQAGEEGQALSLIGLIDLLVNLAKRLDMIKLAVNDELSVRYGNDAGWANVWRAVSVRKALA
ncbi:MAG: glycosyltransferase [Ideonella sp.]|nr:glycosyltransferase [Ideonella sp.]